MLVGAVPRSHRLANIPRVVISDSGTSFLSYVNWVGGGHP